MKGTTALVLAGGINKGFSVLTDNRAKSAMPICGHFRIIDFVLTNLSLSGIDNVGVIIQYLPGSLIDHIGIGRAYDYDTSNRTFKMMPPFVGMGKTDWFRGTADAIYQNLNFIHDTRADLVLVLSGDHVYSMDYAPLVALHRERGADLTIVTRNRPVGSDPTIFGYATCERTGRVREFMEKPDAPPHDTISTGIYLFDARVLCERLESLQNKDSHNLPVDLIQPLVQEGTVYCHPYEDDWHYIQNLESYVALHRKILKGECLLHKSLWHVMTNMRDRELGSRPSPYFGAASHVQESLISPGCVIEGTVLNSVLSPGVYVAPNAIVRDSILFHDCHVDEGARLCGVVSDKDAVFNPYCHLGGEELDDANPTLDSLIVVGKGAQVEQGVRINPGTCVHIDQIVSHDMNASSSDPSASSRIKEMK